MKREINNFIHGQQSGTLINSIFLPGMRWILAGLAILLLTCLWPILFHWGVPFSKSITARVGGVFGPLFLIVGALIFVHTLRTHKLLTPFRLITIRLWKSMLLILLFIGIICGNGFLASTREFIFFWILAEFMVVGADDRFWYAIEKPLTVIFYIAVLLVLCYYETSMLVVDSKGQGAFYSSVAEIGGRYTWSLVYDLRPLIAIGAFLGVWGFVRPRGGLWRVAQMFAPFPFFFIEVGLFQFRSVAFLTFLMGVSLLVLRPLLETRRRPKATAILLVAVIAGMLVFIQTHAYDKFIHRTFQETRGKPILQSRLAELSAYTSDLGWEIVFGHGFGGSFDASDVFVNKNTSSKWRTLHFGLFALTLKGGIPMLFLFLLFLFPGFILHHKSWYNNPCNLTAALFFPILMFQLLMNPISMTPVWLFKFIPAIMVLSRFARRKGIADIKDERTTSAQLSKTDDLNFNKSCRIDSSY